MKELTAADVMNPQVLAVRPDMTAHELASFLTENQITGAPVLDRRGRLVGVVSETDIAEAELAREEAVDDRSDPALDLRGWEQQVEPEEMRALHVHVASGLTVRDIMTPTAYTVPCETPVKDLARTMVTGRIHRLLVTREDHIVGIVTSLDLLKLLYGGDESAAVVRARLRPRSVLIRS